MILGENIKLRALKREDMNKILQWVNEPEIRILTGGIFPVSEIEHERWFEARVLDPINKLFAIECIKTTEIIGIIGLKNVDLINSNTEIYIYIGDKNYWGKGYGTEAVSKFVNFCFMELNLQRVYLYAFDYNERAILSYEKVGFKVEGILKNSLYKQGNYHNKILMAILKDDLN